MCDVRARFQKVSDPVRRKEGQQGGETPLRRVREQHTPLEAAQARDHREGGDAEATVETDRQLRRVRHQLVGR